MPIRSTDDLIDALKEAKLLSPSQMDILVMSLRAGFVEPAELAEDLVLKRWLTLYQAKEVFRGRGKKLYLGPYLLLDRLGAGSMSVVFKARHRRLGRIDALKVIRPERLDDPRVLRCFLDEAEAAARLSHPNVVSVYDAGATAGSCFLAMEYVEGTDLERLVKRHGRLPAARACRYVQQAALGLQHAHDRGLVHRDVKPSNLLLSLDGTTVKMGDLGMALLPPRGEGKNGAAVFSNRALMGTPDYVAPEQVEDPWGVDGRADIYALGCTLYFLLTGRPPFQGGTPLDKLQRHRLEEPPGLKRLQRRLPAGLVAVLRHLLAKKREERCQTPREASQALAPFC
jgi:serine/threonine protein kinase